MSPSDPNSTQFFHVTVWYVRPGSAAGGLYRNLDEAEVIRRFIIPHVLFLLVDLKRSELSYVIKQSEVEFAIEEVKKAFYDVGHAEIDAALQRFNVGTRHVLTVSRSHHRVGWGYSLFWPLGIFHQILGSNVRDLLLKKVIKQVGFSDGVFKRSVDVPPAHMTNYTINHGTMFAGDNHGVAGDHIGDIIQNDFESLSAFLEAQGVALADILELKSALKEDSSKEKDPSGSRVRSWIEKMVEKTATGAWEYATGQAGIVLKGAIATYLGVGP